MREGRNKRYNRFDVIYPQTTQNLSKSESEQAIDAITDSLYNYTCTDEKADVKIFNEEKVNTEVDIS